MRSIFTSLLFTAALGGCGSPQIEPNPVPLPAANSGEPAYAVELRPQIEQLRKDMLAPAIVVLVRSPKLGDWAAGFGTRARDSAEPVSVDDHFRIGSCTKTWVGTVVLQLVGEGKLRLDDPISKFHPGVPKGDAITIEQLLGMRTSLGNYTESLELNQAMDATPQRVWKPDELLQFGYALPEYTAKDVHYSNTNTVLLGLVIEQIAGKPLETVFAERLFAPLGLADTVMAPLTSNALLEPHPRAYRYGTNASTVKSEALSAEDQAAAKAGALLPHDETDDNPSWGWAAGAGISRADDLARYAKKLVAGGLLPADLQQLRMASFHPFPPPNDKTFYGLGLAKFGPFYGHTGELPGFNTFMGYDPTHDITLIIWATLSASPAGDPPANVIAKLLIPKLATLAAALPADIAGNLE